ncbi:ArsR/SmtB family transcription factor [Rhizobium ruizarguesonis]|uniref:ArsR/SmtB family transcription factor n=1 Tax=Rhizobium ruizarguesonis TaxID=2081791 RepID=UPI001FE1D671
MIVNDRELADYFSALANTSRLSVLRTLAKGEISATELATSVGLSQSALSHHLKVLKRQQVVKARREAQTIYYSLASHRSEKAVSLSQRHIVSRRTPDVDVRLLGLQSRGRVKIAIGRRPRSCLGS